ncbi:class I SAM-dependent DNA methyltransferase [Geothrix oryzisoli]|uniref:class I SAM-dependent DNA methyltransferase n=1 Tax=Geothrix oryzisoli TaxID=2922721 RepID=UPI001FACE81B|nr:class I SAM-dependent methyltransferase [Geothrix oryzisoli]
MADWFEAWFDDDYALLYAHRDAGEARLAVGRALQEAPELGRGPVLDLGCGTGRHLEILRRTNPLAFGMDLSPALLDLAPADLRPWLLRGDMRTVPVKPGTLSGVCLWFTPFGYFSDEQNRALLVDLGRLLRPGGVLLMDYLNADEVVRSLVPQDTLERAGVRVLSRRVIEGERIVKRMTLTRLDTGETREAMESVRLYHPAALQAMARIAGLGLRSVMGTYAGAAFHEDSPRWIGIFEKAPTTDS